MPEIHGRYQPSEFEQQLAEWGNEVEAEARNLFPGGFMVERRSAGARELTAKLIAEKTPVIYQAVFATEQYLAATDVIVWNEKAGAYDLFEIKMSSTDEEEREDGTFRRDKQKEEQYANDLAFQCNVVEACGIRLNQKYLVRLNRSYVRDGDLDYSQLFIREDMTEYMRQFQPIVALSMNQAYEYVAQEKEPEGMCKCIYRGRSKHCTTFAYNNPHVPEYSVHDLNRIGSSKRQLRELVDAGILHIEHVPLDETLRKKEKKYNQVIVHKTGEPLIDVDAIRDELGKLEFPLYFLDYETMPMPIPPYSGYRPYQHIVYQYSLHVLPAPDAELQHFGDIVLGGDPSEKIAEQLRTHIGDKGAIIVWSKRFENSRNKELARLAPQYQRFFESVIARTYDLMDIVENQLYVHPGFHGRASIKKVLPVLVPEMSHEKLAIGNGSDWMAGYLKLTDGTLQGSYAEQMRNDLLEYCKYDTRAMVEIWRRFYDVANSPS